MADDARAVGFWRTVPGILTALAGTVSAVAALVVALSQAGVLPRRGASEERLPAIDGRWTAQVAYPWGVTQNETFEFRVEGTRVSGKASFLGVPRAIEDGTISETHVMFTTRGEVLLGQERQPVQQRYDGLITTRGIQFALVDTRGNGPTEFTVRRAP